MATSTLSQLANRKAGEILSLTGKRNNLNAPIRKGSPLAKRIAKVSGGRVFSRLLKLHYENNRTFSGNLVPRRLGD